MANIGIIVCGNSGIDYIQHAYDIEVMRSTLIFGQEEYTDYVDIKAEAFYAKLQADQKIIPSTAQTATGVILELYEKMRDKGYEEILVITISSKLSGTYDGAQMAAKMVEGVKVTVFDSLSLAYAEAHMAITAAEMAKKGAKMSDIVDTLTKIRDHQGLLISVDTLLYLVKNGRLSGASGFVGGLLKIKPMLQLSREGKVEAVEKIRTRKKALDRVVEKFIEEHSDDVEAFIIHAHAGAVVDDVRAALLDKKPDLGEIKDYPLTPVVGAHAGPGALAIGWIKKTI